MVGGGPPLHVGAPSASPVTCGGSLVLLQARRTLSRAASRGEVLFTSPYFPAILPRCPDFRRVDIDEPFDAVCRHKVIGFWSNKSNPTRQHIFRLPALINAGSENCLLWYLFEFNLAPPGEGPKVALNRLQLPLYVYSYGSVSFTVLLDIFLLIYMSQRYRGMLGLSSLDRCELTMTRFV